MRQESGKNNKLDIGVKKHVGVFKNRSSVRMKMFLFD